MASPSCSSFCLFSSRSVSTWTKKRKKDGRTFVSWESTTRRLDCCSTTHQPQLPVELRVLLLLYLLQARLLAHEQVLLHAPGKRRAHLLAPQLLRVVVLAILPLPATASAPASAPAEGESLGHRAPDVCRPALLRVVRLGLRLALRTLLRDDLWWKKRKGGSHHKKKKEEEDDSVRKCRLKINKIIIIIIIIIKAREFDRQVVSTFYDFLPTQRSF